MLSGYSGTSNHDAFAAARRPTLDPLSVVNQPEYLVVVELALPVATAVEVCVVRSLFEGREALEVLKSLMQKTTAHPARLLPEADPETADEHQLAVLEHDITDHASIRAASTEQTNDAHTRSPRFIR